MDRLFTATIILLLSVGTTLAHKDYHELNHWEIPSKNPDRIILTFNGDPATSRAVTWRTEKSVEEAVAQIAVAGVNSDFSETALTLEAKTESFNLGEYKKNTSFKVNYHSAIFKDLEPDTLYAYRLGDGEEHWSEWIQFRTAKKEYARTQFVYFGDAQNKILSHWSRVMRMAYQTAPQASFAIHAGDLVNFAHKDQEWAEWFKAGGFIHSQWTAIPVVGNHEFRSPELGLPKELSLQWCPQFTLPVEEGLSPNLHETAYTVDYQDCRIIVLNSNTDLEEQNAYLESKLKDCKAKWKIVTCHHSLFSPAGDRDFLHGRKQWSPILDKYGVDLVLNGHDHTYARGHKPVVTTVGGEERLGAVYITSVSGPKQYKYNANKIEVYKEDGYQADKTQNDTQFYQVITIEGSELTYVAYTVLGEEYDRVVIKKDFSNGRKELKK